MGPRFIVSVVLVFGLAAVIGVVEARNQAAPAVAIVPTAAPTPAPTTAPNAIDILPDPSDSEHGIFKPSTLTIKVGQKVTWLNLDGKAHSAIADNSAFTTSVMLTGETATWTPTKAGTYTYGDYVDPDMHGTIVVK